VRQQEAGLNVDRPVGAVDLDVDLHRSPFGVVAI
jgi:hypothetical protein